MAKEPKRIDISRIPELLTLAQEVQSTNEPRILQQDSEDLAMLTTHHTRGQEKRQGPTHQCRRPPVETHRDWALRKRRYLSKQT
jgi:hypothetical protein